jgi:hypothetical protein
MVEVRRLVWNPWNVGHIRPHQVTPDEVEEVCHGDPLVQQGRESRLALVGPTGTGRMLTVILDLLVDGSHFVVISRPTSRKERTLYFAEKGRGEP